MAARKTGSQSKGKKGRKVGRMKKKPAYMRYLSEHRREKNKARHIVRYMKKFPNWEPINLSEMVAAFVKRFSNG